MLGFRVFSSGQRDRVCIICKWHSPYSEVLTTYSPGHSPPTLSHQENVVISQEEIANETFSKFTRDTFLTIFFNKQAKNFIAHVSRTRVALSLKYCTLIWDSVMRCFDFSKTTVIVGVTSRCYHLYLYFDCSLAHLRALLKSWACRINHSKSWSKDSTSKQPF